MIVTSPAVPRKRMVIESESEASGKEDEEEEEESEEEEVSLASEEEEGEESDFEMSDVEEKEVEKLLASREVDGKLEFLVKYKVFFFFFLFLKLYRVRKQSVHRSVEYVVPSRRVGSTREAGGRSDEPSPCAEVAEESPCLRS